MILDHSRPNDVTEKCQNFMPPTIFYRSVQFIDFVEIEVREKRVEP